jgi:LysM repeat protein
MYSDDYDSDDMVHPNFFILRQPQFLQHQKELFKFYATNDTPPYNTNRRHSVAANPNVFNIDNGEIGIGLSQNKNARVRKQIAKHPKVYKVDKGVTLKKLILNENYEVANQAVKHPNFIKVNEGKMMRNMAKLKNLNEHACTREAIAANPRIFNLDGGKIGIALSQNEYPKVRAQIAKRQNIFNIDNGKIGIGLSQNINARVRAQIAKHPKVYEVNQGVTLKRLVQNADKDVASLASEHPNVYKIEKGALLHELIKSGKKGRKTNSGKKKLREMAHAAQVIRSKAANDRFLYLNNLLNNKFPSVVVSRVSKKK